MNSPSYCFALGVRRWRAFLQRAKRRSLHRFGSPGGSLRDQVLASLEPGFARDRNVEVVATPA